MQGCVICDVVLCYVCYSDPTVVSLLQGLSTAVTGAPTVPQHDVGARKIPTHASDLAGMNSSGCHVMMTLMTGNNGTPLPLQELKVTLARSLSSVSWQLNDSIALANDMTSYILSIVLFSYNHV